ncbi:helix-turn-helix domain-containing protein [Streptomyces sp. B3I7]|uniref:helix-turn-helix domain-containing protein n=1 Tax=Streptomyces sp. B3I7 TaxID=3042269 RepID=UPI003590220B
MCTRDEAGLVVHATQDEVARAVGPVREVVARTLRDFAHEGLIARGPRAIRLVGPAGFFIFGISLSVYCFSRVAGTGEVPPTRRGPGRAAVT